VLHSRFYIIFYKYIVAGKQNKIIIRLFRYPRFHYYPQCPPHCLHYLHYHRNHHHHHHYSFSFYFKFFSFFLFWGVDLRDGRVGLDDSSERVILVGWVGLGGSVGGDSGGRVGGNSSS
jgi:hypothetical protein